MAESFDIGFVKEYQPGSDARVELKNGRFVDVASGRYLDSGTSVTIKGGRIESVVGPSDAPAAAAPDFTIDLGGRAVTPGLFNTHCHVAMTLPTGLAGLKDVRLSKKYHDKQLAKNMAECLARGVTTLRDAWSPDLRHNRALKEKISRGKIHGPRILQSVVVGPLGAYLSEERNLTMRIAQYALGAPSIDYENANCGSVVFPKDADEKEIRDAVDRAVDERGADFIKIGEQLENMVDFKPTLAITSMEQLRALAEQANRRGLRSTIHHVSVETFHRAVEGGVSSLAHAPCNARLTEAHVEAFIAADGIIEPTSTVSYDVCWKIDGDPYRDHPEMDRLTRFRDETFMALADDYWIPKLSERVKRAYPKLTAGKMKAMGFLDMTKMFKYYSGMVADGTENLKMLFEAGGCFACGNDGGVPSSTPAMVGLELKMLGFVLNGESGNGESGARGFTGAEAVRVATINSARALGLEDKFGSIDAGKTADLVVLDGDPLADIGVIGSRAAALFLDGRLAIDNCGLEVSTAGS